MKKLLLILVGCSAIAGGTFALTGCVGGEVGVGVDAGPYYDDGPWVWGHDHAGWGAHGGGFRGGWGGGRHR